VTIEDFEVPALYAALDTAREDRSITWTALTREVNALFRDVPCHPIATSTITSMKSKDEVIGNAALQMLVWLDRAPESFVRGYDGAGEKLQSLPPNRILRFDTPAIFEAINAARAQDRLSWREVAGAIGGVNAAHLPQLAKGAGIGINSAARIAQWLGRSVASLTVASRQ
jgi:hypothetical protein